MTLPKRPPLTDPIPNYPIPLTPETFFVNGPYWYARVGEGLSVDSEGSIQLVGEASEPATSYLYGPNGILGVGTGLTLSNGEFSVASDFPPYFCSTNVKTAGVKNFYYTTGAFFSAYQEGDFDVIGGGTIFDYFRREYNIEFPPLQVSATSVSPSTGFSYIVNDGVHQLVGVIISRGDSGDVQLVVLQGLSPEEGKKGKEGSNVAYKVGDSFTIPGSYVGGIDGVDNITITFTPNSIGLIKVGAWQDCEINEFPLLNTSSGEDFSFAWKGCFNLGRSGPDSSGNYGPPGSGADFPLLDTGNGTTFFRTWEGCSGLTSFPDLNVGSGTNFSWAWSGCSNINSFPSLNFDKGLNFSYAWEDCSQLVNFPPSLFDNCLATDFSYSWVNCSLSEESVDNILVSIDSAGQSDGVLDLRGDFNSSPGPSGLVAIDSLTSRGWTVLYGTYIID